MGEQNMSDLDKQIERWRANLAQTGTFTEVDIEELESHLREEIAPLQQKGLSEPEAFLVARYRLGDASTLEEEYAKVSADSRALQLLSLMAVGTLLFLGGGYIANGITRGVLLLAIRLGMYGFAMRAFGTATFIAMLVGFFVLGWLIFQKWDRIEPAGLTKAVPGTRSTLVLIAIVLFACAVVGGQALFAAVVARTLYPADYGLVAPMWSRGALAWAISAPIAAAALVLALRVRAQRHHDACLDGAPE